MKKQQSKIQPIKTAKEIGTRYCLGCKEYTHIFRPQELKMINKVLRENSNYIVCQSKSRFSKQKYNNKK